MFSRASLDLVLIHIAKIATNEYLLQKILAHHIVDSERATTVFNSRNSQCETYKICPLACIVDTCSGCTKRFCSGSCNFDLLVRSVLIAQA